MSGIRAFTTEGGVVMSRSIGSSPHRDHAALALDYAVAALAVAERENCGDDEIVGLCDEVVKRRLRLQVVELANGWWPTPGLLARMTRDRLLLGQSATNLPTKGVRPTR